MPAALRLDTLKFARRLTDAGLPREAAEAIVEGLNEADLSELATKADIGEVRHEVAEVKKEIAALRGEVSGEVGGLRAELKSSIADLRGELRTSIADLRADLYGRLWVMGLGIVGLNVALMKLLP